MVGELGYLHYCRNTGVDGQWGKNRAYIFLLIPAYPTVSHSNWSGGKWGWLTHHLASNAPWNGRTQRSSHPERGDICYTAATYEDFLLSIHVQMSTRLSNSAAVEGTGLKESKLNSFYLPFYSFVLFRLKVRSHYKIRSLSLCFLLSSPPPFIYCSLFLSPLP